MNKLQKILFSVSATLTALIVFYWLSQGGEMLTKTKVLVDKTSELDKMLGVKNEVWVDKFVLGFDYVAILIIGILAITLILNYLFKTNRKET
jgi:hypothetical protein